MGVFIGVSAITSNRYPALLLAHRFDMVIEIALSFLLAVLSWRFIERPFRSGSLRLSGRPLFALAGAVMLILLAFSSWTVFAGGFKWRFPAAAVQVASEHHDNEEIIRTGCFITSDYHFEKYDYNLCLRQDDSGKENDLLLGDSHSAMLWSALSSSLQGSNVMQASTFGCRPLLHPAHNPDCMRMMTYMFQTYLPTHPGQKLFLVGRWSQRDLAELTATVTWAKQHNVPVTVFGPVPEYDGPLPRLLAYSIAWNKPNLANQHRVSSIAPLDAEMQALSQNVWHVPYISLYQQICDSDSCTEYADAAHKLPMMDDTNHLSQFGAYVVVRRLVAQGQLH